MWYYLLKVTLRSLLAFFRVFFYELHSQISVHEAQEIGIFTPKPISFTVHTRYATKEDFKAHLIISRSSTHMDYILGFLNTVKFWRNLTARRLIYDLYRIYHF